MKRIFSCLIISCIIAVFAIRALAAEWKTAEDFKKAQEEAEEAIRRTGPNGPKKVPVQPGETGTIRSTAVDIVFPGKNLEKHAAEIEVSSEGLDINSVPVARAMSDLHAQKTDNSIIINLKNDVLFDFDKWDIKPQAGAILAKVAVIIKKKSKGIVLVEGHTDSKGSLEYNQKLSERRAEAVKAWLVNKYGLNPERFLVKGWGETRPVAPNTNKDGSDNPAGRALNRRVTITIPIK